MADDEYEMEWGSDEGNGDQGAQGSEGEIEIENNFYEAEGSLKTDRQGALEKFEVVVMMEESRGSSSHSFAALKHVVVLAMQLGQYPKMIET
jgi:hypothetical protein